MSIKCDECGKWLNPNDESVYTESGGAICHDDRKRMGLEYDPRKLSTSKKGQIEVVFDGEQIGIDDIAMALTQILGIESYQVSIVKWPV